MKLVATQYLPFNNKGEQVTMEEGEKLAYHARSFRWVEVPCSAPFVRDRLLQDPVFMDEIWRSIANAAEQADCERRRMGCVVTSLSLNLRAVGFNCKPKGMEGSCREIGCVPAITCRLTDHAEAYTLARINPEFDASGYILFNTAVPCLDCMKLCRHRNVRVVVYREERDQPELDRPIMSALSIRSGIVFLRLSE